MEATQVKEKYEKWKPDSIKMVQNYGLMWEGHLRQTNLGRQKICLSLPDALPKHLALYRAGTKQQDPKCEEVA